ncbi:Dihydroorotase [Methylophaga frappieri]|uniref:Dihydroorotase n=1 Tax=Methylophaga frappieri (strain ATCC BAA-2434 / DSM 25690 / JAM7) TaxID=754477 RepID=I1YLI0_METFJ|nr:dihydroorotase [Methylophaga frappieri]AFJ03773.1 Dihydroorotase [Methylophaga frappieri]
MISSSTNTLTITRPDDWHLHLRDDTALQRTVTDTARQFVRAIVMPNLRPPVTTTAMANDYRQRILAARPDNSDFEPLMTLYLTDNTPASEIEMAVDSEFVKAVKLYPAGATTNSDAGVTHLRHCANTLEMMQKLGMPLLIHGEVTDPEIDIFDREKRFIEDKLIQLRRDFPELKIVFEHITTKDAADYVNEANAYLAATITPHHLLYNRNDLLVGGIRPHYFCLPILKRNIHQQALLKAATSGSNKFFLGTDSAPHPRHDKESSCGCAGIYSAHAALEFYAEAFESMNALDKLEAFASFHGPDFYGLPRNKGTITLHRKAWQVPESLDFADSQLIPLRAGEMLQWQSQATMT